MWSPRFKCGTPLFQMWNPPCFKCGPPCFKCGPPLGAPQGGQNCRSGVPRANSRTSPGSIFRGRGNPHTPTESVDSGLEAARIGGRSLAQIEGDIGPRQQRRWSGPPRPTAEASVSAGQRLLAHPLSRKSPSGHQHMAAAVSRTVFAQPDADAVSDAWDEVAAQLGARFPKVAALMAHAKPEAGPSPCSLGRTGKDLVRRPPRTHQQRDQTPITRRGDLPQPSIRRPPRRSDPR